MKTVTTNTSVAKGTAQRMYSRFGFKGYIEGKKGLQQFRTNLMRIEDDSVAMYHSRRLKDNFNCSAPYLVDYESTNNNLESTVFDSEEGPANDNSSAFVII